MSATRPLQKAAQRSVERIVESHVAPVGTFTVRRALPNPDHRAIGPWVFLDHFGPYRANPGVDGVGAHPHAGIETVTYLLSGRNEHRDSAGHRGIVSAGGAQWMTAGRGIVHSERPLAQSEAELTVHGIQLWTTLPRALKSMEPRYQRLDASSIPAVKGDGWTARLIAGALGDIEGPAQTLMPTLLWHVTLAPGARLEAPVDATFELACYVLEGEGAFGGEERANARVGQLVIWQAPGEMFTISNPGAAKLELMVLGGAPAEGPLVFHGPFVMNTIEQVRAAEIAYRTGRMGSLPGE